MRCLSRPEASLAKTIASIAFHVRSCFRESRSVRMQGSVGSIGSAGFDALHGLSSALILGIAANSTIRSIAPRELDLPAMGPVFQRLCLAAFGP
jgi:hypothetical protein